MIEMEFKTTTQAAKLDPKPPEGDGWRLAGSAVRLAGITLDPAVYMYWQRPSNTMTRECPNPKCRSIAFDPLGNCLGCGRNPADG